MIISPRWLLFVLLSTAAFAAETDADKKLRALSPIDGEAAGRDIDGKPRRSSEPVVPNPGRQEPAVALPPAVLIAQASDPVVPAAGSEAEAVGVIVRLAQAQVRAQHAADKIAHRDAHAKHHGCVKASFTVAGKDELPENLRAGVFQPGAKYPAIIRYSNGQGKPAPDSKGDGRGMAVKLFGVPGPKLHPSESGTQDFLMINHPAFFVRSATDYVAFMNATAGGGFPRSFFFNGWPWNWRMKELGVVVSIMRQSPTDMLALRYFSMVPYRLGPERNMKYSAKPCADRRKGYPSESRDFLRENLTTALASESACFDFMLQLQAPGMSLEDSVVEWDEKESPFIPVARIVVEPQAFDTPEKMTACENLSFSPWHAVPEHEPLGPVNRIRLAVYDAVSALRHELNGAPRSEPAPF